MVAVGQKQELRPEVIYDFGMNNGDDIPYYLARARRVVGVEANAPLCAEVRARFRAEVEAGRLIVLPVAVSAVEGPEALPFFIHKTDRALSQLPPPANSAEFEQVLVPCRTPESVVREYGSPLYIKIDLEHSDAAVLSSLFAAGIFPPEISAEAHSAEVFALLAANGYSAFNLVDGPSVPKRYPGFAPGSAGPFGTDIAGEWWDADSFLYVLAAEGLGWKDIHASRTVQPRAAITEREIWMLHARNLGRRTAAGMRWRLLRR